MKLLGLVCMVLACAGAGFYASGRLRREAAAVTQLIALTEDCGTYIRTLHPELPELLSMLAEHPNYRQFSFLRAVSSALLPGITPDAVWERAVREDAGVPAGVRQILTGLGAVLGTTDTAGQLAALGLYRTMLENAEKESRERYARLGKLYRALGLLGGAAAAVLFV